MRVAAKERSGVTFGLYGFSLTLAFLGIDLPSSAVPSYLFLRSGSTERTLGSTPSLEEDNVKSTTKQSLMKRVNSQSSFTTTCKPSDTGTFYQLLHRTIGQHLSMVLFLLLSMGVGLGTATSQAQTRAYVALLLDNTVSVIDTATNTGVAGIPVCCPLGVAITPDGTRAYVTNAGYNTVLVIDTVTNTVVATITVGESPFGVAITPAPQAPKSKEECKHGGYLKFGPPAGPFKNQGQCVSYVEHH